jgi:uncharacterized membrane protein YraQ (UPF0718 family)
MNTSSLILLGLAVILLVYALIRGENLAVEGLKQAGLTLWDNLVILLAGFLVAGLLQVLIPKELISTWLGDQAGAKAVIIGCLAGGIIPGSPYAVFPIVGSFYHSGAGLGAIVGYLTAWALWFVSRLPVEIALVNPKVSLIRYAITFIVPPAAGFIAHGLSKWIK